MTTNTYTYLAFIGNASTITPYINGTAQTPVALTTQMTAVADTMFIGSYDGAQFFFDGTLIELDIDNAADSAGQVTRMNSYVNTTYANPL